ncbi:hypothetical protein [Rhodopila sp.]|uniref:hypothetical protein n=1 Tax=Rhodopila sp. TaxID=2480087 RepID=UPI003D14497D
MRSRSLLAPLAVGCLSLSHHADAHGFAGDHMFISTLLIDDANVADEASLPTFSYQPQSADGGPTSNLYGAGFEFDKRITENFGFALNQGYNWLTQPGAKTANGWQNLVVTLKYKPYVNDRHEILLSVGVQREIARTGANGSNGAVLGNDDSGSTTPTLYFAKGFGDIPVGWLRPFALTGELGYQIADKKLKVDPVDDSAINNGISNGWTGGLSLQYSIRYLSAEVKDYGLPDFVNKLTPVVELAWSSPASKPNQDSTQYLWGVGLNYTATTYAVGVEALVPGNRESGSHLGVIAQFHLYFDDLLPHSLGEPIVDWF